MGRVRPDRTRRGWVTALDYDADRTVALAAIGRLVGEARRRFGAQEVVVWHRIGRVPVGDTAVIIGVAAAHRLPAFQAVRFLIERLKREIPIWKADRVRPARRRPPRRRPRAGR